MPARSSAGTPPPARPAAGACSTPARPATSWPPPPGIPPPAGASLFSNRDGTATAHGCSLASTLGRPTATSDTSAGIQDHPTARGQLIPAAPAHPCPRVRQAPRSRPAQRNSTGQRTPTPAQAARLAAFLRGLNLTLEPIAKGGCDHAAAEPRYTPSRKLAHLVRARTATCDAPGCAAQAVHADLDHTIPYPSGPTDQCNLGPKCRRHHKAKQAPGWKVEQPEPGVVRWTRPAAVPTPPGQPFTISATYDPCDRLNMPGSPRGSLPRFPLELIERKVNHQDRPDDSSQHHDWLAVEPS